MDGWKFGLEMRDRERERERCLGNQSGSEVLGGEWIGEWIGEESMMSIILVGLLLARCQCVGGSGIAILYWRIWGKFVWELGLSSQSGQLAVRIFE